MPGHDELRAQAQGIRATARGQVAGLRSQALSGVLSRQAARTQAKGIRSAARSQVGGLRNQAQALRERLREQARQRAGGGKPRILPPGSALPSIPRTPGSPPLTLRRPLV